MILLRLIYVNVSLLQYNVIIGKLYLCVRDKLLYQGNRSIYISVKTDLLFIWDLSYEYAELN